MCPAGNSVETFVRYLEVQMMPLRGSKNTPRFRPLEPLAVFSRWRPGCVVRCCSSACRCRPCADLQDAGQRRVGVFMCINEVADLRRFRPPS